jgi:hypothetical protein
MNPRLTVVLMIVLAAALMRIVPHPANVTPIAAMALFAGAYLPDRRMALLIPLAAMLLSDLVIGLHASMLYVYAGVAVTVLIGAGMLRKNPSVMPAIAASLVSSVLFFLITNYGTWVTGVLYPQTAEGLMMAYTAGIPFFRNSILGDLFFTAILFGGFQALERWLPSLQTRSAV